MLKSTSKQVKKDQRRKNKSIFESKRKESLVCTTRTSLRLSFVGCHVASLTCMYHQENCFDTSVNHYVKPFECFWVIQLDTDKGILFTKVTLNNDK